MNILVQRPYEICRYWQIFFFMLLFHTIFSFTTCGYSFDSSTANISVPYRSMYRKSINFIIRKPRTVQPRQRRIGQFSNNNQHDCYVWDQTSNAKFDPDKPCFLGNVNTQIVVEENQPILLRCLIYNVNFSTVVISWWREGQLRELTLGLETLSSRYRLPRLTYQDWSLQISNAQLDDSGTYFCQINLEQTFEKFFDVKVIRRNTDNFSEHEYVKDEAPQTTPSIWIKGQNEGYEGSVMQLSCIAHFTKYSPNTTLVWFRDPQSSSSSSHYPVRYSVKSEKYPHSILTSSDGMIEPEIQLEHVGNNSIVSIFTIRRLQLEHAGLWKCAKVGDRPNYSTNEARVVIYVRRKRIPQTSRVQMISSENQQTKSLSNHKVARYWIFYPVLQSLIWTGRTI